MDEADHGDEGGPDQGGEDGFGNGGESPGDAGTGDKDSGDGPPDLDELARRAMDLWQAHLAAIARDPENAALIGRLLATASATGEAVARGLRAFTDELTTAGARAAEREGREHGAAGEAGNETGSDDTPWPTAPWAASWPGGPDVDELRQRVAALEERVATLERERNDPDQR